VAKGQQRSNREKKKPKMDKNKKKGGVPQPPASAANKWTPTQSQPGKKP